MGRADCHRDGREAGEGDRAEDRHRLTGISLESRAAHDHRAHRRVVGDGVEDFSRVLQPRIHDLECRYHVFGGAQNLRQADAGPHQPLAEDESELERMMLFHGTPLASHPGSPNGLLVAAIGVSLGQCSRPEQSRTTARRAALVAHSHTQQLNPTSCRTPRVIMA